MLKIIRDFPAIVTMVIINSINKLNVKMNRLSSQDVTFKNTPSRTLTRPLRRP